MSAAPELDVFSCPLDGIRLVEASAGTGKTWNLCGLYLRLLLERGLEVQRILVVTFTNAATSELRDRLRLRGPFLEIGRVGDEVPDDLAGLVQGHHQQAVVMVHHRPRFAAVHVGRALLLDTLGRRAEALAAFERASALSGHRGRYRERFERYRAALDRSPASTRGAGSQ